MSLNLKPTVDNWHSFVLGELELFRGFVINIEKRISDELTNFESQQESQELLYPDDGSGFIQVVTVKDGLDDASWDLESVFKDYFPNLHKKAIVVSFYSYLEDALKELCIRYQYSNSLIISYSDFKGKGIEKFRRYLVKVVGLDFEKLSNSWNEIINIRDLRNIVVHNEGKIPPNNQALLQYVEKHKNLELNNNFEVKISEGFLTAMLSTMQHFFDDIQKLIIDGGTNG